MSKKYIFDSNAVSRNENIDKLKSSNLVSKISSGEISLYLTPTLLEERLDFLDKPIAERNEQGIAAGKYVLSLPFKRVFRDIFGPEGILMLELEQNLMSSTLYLSQSDSDHLISEAILRLNNEIDDEDYFRSKLEWRERKKARRGNYVDMRKYTAQKFDEENLNWLNARFEMFYKENLISHGKTIIMENSNNPELDRMIVDRWEKDPKRFPYWNDFVRGRLYLAFYAMNPSYGKIDEGAHEDLDQLLYLRRVDGIISNEKKFMKNAHEYLYPDKEFLSVDEFVKKLD